MGEFQPPKDFEKEFQDRIPRPLRIYLHFFNQDPGS